MHEIKLIDIKEEILSDNRGLAEKLRKRMKKKKVLLINIMGSPGAGKTCFIIKTIESLKEKYRFAVIEADIDSMVDSEKVNALGIRAVQMRTGGFCHVDAGMMEKTLEQLCFTELDVIFLENVGNLVCPAESDTGAFKNITILSVPEGDDKPLKYPLIFSVSDVMIVSKIDYMGLSDFNLSRLENRVQALNSSIRIFPLSSISGAGMEDWISFLDQEISLFLNRDTL